MRLFHPTTYSKCFEEADKWVDRDVFFRKADRHLDSLLFGHDIDARCWC